LTADSARAAAITVAELEAAVRAAWCRETSDDPDEWTPDNPARGQCGVTALVIRDYLGGEVLIAGVVPAGREAPTERHGWNRFASGHELDLTREQFRNGETLGPPVVAEPCVKTHGCDRYALLAARVRDELDR
jgi:hypothetical protein